MTRRVRELLITTANEQSDCRYKHAAVAFHGEKLIAKAANKKLRDGESIHAEQLLLRKLPKDIPREEIVIYVGRVNNRGQLRMSRPCSWRCQPLLEKAGIKNVFYTVNE